jgi:hypothetical protein
MAVTDSFTPVQRRMFELLRRAEQPTVFPTELVDDLLHSTRSALAELSARNGGADLFVSKGFLQRVHGCEALHLHSETHNDFSWSPATAAGFVAHKALELMLNWQGEPLPADLVDSALASLADSPGTQGSYVASLTEAERAELRSKAVDRTTKFLYDFPHLPSSAVPVLEASMRFAPPGTITLSGKADLMLGKPVAGESHRIIIDFKSGWRTHHHRTDLRFYALLHTLKDRVPPRRLITYYLDESEAEVEDVTEGVLQSALRSTLDGIERHIELTVEGRPAMKRPGNACRWCPIAADCAEGTAHLAALRNDD